MKDLVSWRFEHKGWRGPYSGNMWSNEGVVNVSDDDQRLVELYAGRKCVNEKVCFTIKGIWVYQNHRGINSLCEQGI